MIEAGLCVAALSLSSAEEVVRALAERLRAAGRVLPSFAPAAVLREKKSPTGLPFEGCAVAMPHAESEHVTSPAIAVASLAKPVKFRQMGAPQIVLDVRLVVMPAFTAKEQAAGTLSVLVTLLQDAALREALANATSPEAMHAALAARRTA